MQLRARLFIVFVIAITSVIAAVTPVLAGPTPAQTALAASIAPLTNVATCAVHKARKTNALPRTGARRFKDEGGHARRL